MPVEGRSVLSFQNFYGKFFVLHPDRPEAGKNGSAAKPPLPLSRTVEVPLLLFHTVDRGVLLYLQENLTAGEQVGKALVSSQLLLVNGDLAVGAQDGLLIGQALGPVVPGADVVQRLLHAAGSLGTIRRM